MNIRRRYFALAGAVAVAAGLGLAAPAAHADPVGVGVVHNTQGEAGYFANDNGQTRFRYVQATIQVTNQIKFLDGTGGNGGVGTELCDPNTGYSIQLGVQWNGSQFVVRYGAGNLLPGADPCIQSGLVLSPPPVTLAPLALNPVTGDQLSFAEYYNPSTHWVTLNSCDITQDVCRQAHFYVGWRNFYEFGIGAVSNHPNLTAPANNFLVHFYNLAANYYSATHGWNSIFVPAHWNLKRSDWVNGSDQVIMSSNGTLDLGGHTFTLFNGSTSP